MAIRTTILVDGTPCRVLSFGKRELPQTTVGKFRGYTVLGDVEGICIETKDGKIRIIPTLMILAIDILTTATESSATVTAVGKQSVVNKHDDEDKITRYLG